MKVFQIRSSIVLILSFSLIGAGILIPNSSAQDAQIPNWIKNVAGWWASGVISENEFSKSLFSDLENMHPWNRSLKFNILVSFFNSLIWSR